LEEPLAGLPGAELALYQCDERGQPESTPFVKFFVAEIVLGPSAG
jgi:hypothetical protein